MIYLELLLICAIIIFICDLSGAIDNLVIPLVKRALKIPKNANISIKPFDCSLCLTFWLGLLYLLIQHAFTIPNIAYVCLLAYLTPHLKAILLYIKEFLIWIENKFYKIIDET